MKVLIDSSGVILASEQENIFKLSNEVNEVRLYSPFGPEHPVMIHFIRPDGKQPRSRYMAYIGMGDYDEDFKGLYVYAYHLTAYQLAKAGILQASCTITLNGTELNTGTFEADVEASLIVNPENPPIEEGIAEDLQIQINEQQEQLNQQQIEIDQANATANEAKSTAESALAQANTAGQAAANAMAEAVLKVPKTAQIAGIQIQNGISKQDLSDALEIDNKDAEVLDEAKGYADDKAAGAEQNAKDYVDGKFIHLSEKGAPNGLCPLDESRKVSSQYLPSYVDDVVEAFSLSDLPVFGESGKIYVILESGLIYRWSGSRYVEISQSLALGETAQTAYRGDRGAAMYAFLEESMTTASSLAGILDEKLNVSDLYKHPVALTYNTSEGRWEWNFSLGDNAIIEMAGNEPTADIVITNVPTGGYGTVTVKGGQLTLPSNSILSADFGYLTAVGNQYYRYSFYYDGTNFEWNRTVLGDE